MTMVVAIALPQSPYAFAVADMRMSVRNEDGSPRSIGDMGGKLFRFGNAWLTHSAGGHGALLFAAELIHRLACDGSSELDAASSIKRHVTDIRSAIGDRDARLFIARDRNAYRISSEGSLQRSVFHASYPPGRSLAEVQQFARVAQSMQTSSDLLRCTFAEFARVAAASTDTVSATVECGFGPYFLRGEASALAQASDSELQALWRQPPREVGRAGALAFFRALCLVHTAGESGAFARPRGDGQ